MSRKPMYKKPAEKFSFSCNYVNDVPPEATTIESATVSATDDTGADASYNILSSREGTIDGSEVFVHIKSGVDGSRYHINLLVTFDDGSILQDNFIVIVRSNY